LANRQLRLEVMPSRFNVSEWLFAVDQHGDEIVRTARFMLGFEIVIRSGSTATRH
jgi:hypothetical protein